jgi:hypothetical protein
MGVFSKDALTNIDNKQTLFCKFFRVLKSGAASGRRQGFPDRVSDSSTSVLGPGCVETLAVLSV